MEGRRTTDMLCVSSTHEGSFTLPNRIPKSSLLLSVISVTVSVASEPSNISGKILEEHQVTLCATPLFLQKHNAPHQPTL